jgi:acyl-CoA synthetase (AMP-forming)/AMP-acid ligase II
MPGLKTTEPDTLFDLLDIQAEARGGHTALIDGDQTCTYGELRSRALRMAGGLRDAGVKPGDRVLLLVPLSIEFFVVFLAVMRLGAAAVLLDPTRSLKSLRACLRNVRPDVLVGVPKAHLYRVIPEVGAIPLALGVGGRAPFVRSVRPRDSDNATYVDPHSPALLTFTSGSTGTPKTIVRSHDFLLHQHEAVQSVLRPRADDVELSTLPVFILSNIGSGITSALPLKGYARPHRMNTRRMIAYIRAKNVNRLLAAPAFCRRLCDEAARQQTPLGLRRIFTGGGPVFPNLLNDLKKAAPDAEIMTVYGSTEAEPIAHVLADNLSPDDLAATASGAGLLAGRPVEAIRLAIIADSDALPAEMDQAAFQAMTLPSGQAGEIVVTGRHIVETYLDPADDAETKFRVDGTTWHRTGDAGYVDGGGRLWLLGRCSARLTTDDGVLYPFSLEAAIMGIDKVRRAAAVTTGEKIILAVEADWPLTSEQYADLHRRWPSLSAIHPIRHIPVDRRHHSKVLYPELRKRLGV